MTVTPRVFTEVDVPSKNTRKGILLLFKVRDKAIKAIGNHKPLDCPINMAYKITASTSWNGLSFFAKVVLMVRGWDERTYNAFILWYDSSIDGVLREQILRNLLESDTEPFSIAA